MEPAASGPISYRQHADERARPLREEPAGGNGKRVVGITASAACLVFVFAPRRGSYASGKQAEPDQQHETKIADARLLYSCRRKGALARAVARVGKHRRACCRARLGTARY